MEKKEEKAEGNSSGAADQDTAVNGQELINTACQASPTKLGARADVYEDTRAPVYEDAGTERTPLIAGQ